MGTKNFWKFSVLKTRISIFIFLQELLSKWPLTLTVFTQPYYRKQRTYKVDVRENITKDNLSQHLFI